METFKEAQSTHGISLQSLKIMYTYIFREDGKPDFPVVDQHHTQNKKITMQILLL